LDQSRFFVFSAQAVERQPDLRLKPEAIHKSKALGVERQPDLRLKPEAIHKSKALGERSFLLAPNISLLPERKSCPALKYFLV